MMDHNMYLHSWAALFVASVVSLTSLLSEFEDNVDWSKEQKWAVSVTSVSLALAFFAFCFRLTKQEMFTGTHWEHGTVILALIFWAAGLPNLLDPENGLAVGARFGMNANLFFSSWFAFIVVMIMFVQIFPSLVFKDKVSMFATHWIGFGTASLIAMTNAARFWRDKCDSTSDAMCAETAFGFILGALGGLFAIIFMFFQHELIEQMMSIVFCIAWCFGVAYLTYNDGPAMFVGVYFFSVWTSFLFALCMATESFVTLWARMMGTETAGMDEGAETTPTAAGGKGAEETAKHDEEEGEKEETA